MDDDLLDPFTLMAGMSMDKSTESSSTAPAIEDQHDKQCTESVTQPPADECTSLQDLESAEEASASNLCALWEHQGSTGTLVDSLSRQLARLRSNGFELPWKCQICCFLNARCFDSCEICKTCNMHFRAAVSADSAVTAKTNVEHEDHILLVLARSRGPCGVEACFAFCEAMAFELLDPGKAVIRYRHAFKLWSDLDSNLGAGGVPNKLRSEALALQKSNRSSVSNSVPMGTCPILGQHAASLDVLLDQQLPKEPVLESFDFEGLTHYMSLHGVQRIVVMCGAGISTSAGIPDFRSPGSGLYDNLDKYNLPSPEAIFTLDYFRQCPAAFYELVREIWPGNFNPTPCHYFIRLLHEKGLLLRCYTQNIDSLEGQAGLPADKLVAVHGNFDEAHVIDTERKVDVLELKSAIDQGEPGWKQLCADKGGLVKPAITFFGEALPKRFCDLHVQDFAACDLLLVLGTSLAVAPFNGLITKVNPTAPRVLINREPAGLCDQLLGGFRFQCTGPGGNWRDIFVQGEVDKGVSAFAGALGFSEDLENLIKSATMAFETDK